MRTIIEEFTEMIKAVSDRSTNLMEARFFEYNIPNAKRKLERARTKLQDAIVDLQTTNERAEARAKKAETALFVTQEDLETAEARIAELEEENKRLNEFADKLDGVMWAEVGRHSGCGKRGGIVTSKPASHNCPHCFGRGYFEWKINGSQAGHQVSCTVCDGTGKIKNPPNDFMTIDDLMEFRRNAWRKFVERIDEKE